MLCLVDASETIGLPVMVFFSEARKLKEHKMGQQLRLEDTLDGILFYFYFLNGILDE